MEDNTSFRASLACSSCKKQKRKCDKVLPICGFCSHTHRACEYHDLPEKQPSAADFAALEARLALLENRMQMPENPMSIPTPDTGPASSAAAVINAPSSLALAALFLDVDCFKWTQMQLPVSGMQNVPTVSNLRSA